jgi:UDP-N-acetylmuramyl pentapeptide phosphotransferase/UDP-N-acetylglucosamine-1-phosphate transferase
MKYINQTYHFLWLLLIVLIMFLFIQDRTIELENGQKKIVSALKAAPELSITVILLLIILTSVGVLRALESRNDWRKIAIEENVNEKLNQIEKDKKKKSK